MRTRIAAAVVAAILWGGPAVAAPQQPLQLQAAFIDTDTPVVGLTGPACPVTFTQLIDARHDPVTAGDVGNRSVHAPPNAQAWMGDVLTGFKRRGVAVTQDGATPDPATLQAQMTLRTVWIQATTMNLSANVLVTIDATAPDGRTLHKTYRGSVVKMNWASSQDEVERDLGYAFADFLDKAASDLRAVCRPA